MSLDDLRTVDSIGTDRVSGDVVLNILDSWPWNDGGQEEVYRHLIALQDKMNLYMEFIESGQVYNAYPSASGRRLRVLLVSRYPVPKIAREFIAKASAAAEEVGVSIEIVEDQRSGTG